MVTRGKADKASINGVPLIDRAEITAKAHQIIESRPGKTIEAINKHIAGKSKPATP